MDLTPAQFAAMSEAYHQERKITDLQFSWVRQLQAEPYRNHKMRAAPYRPEEFSLFEDTGDGVRRSGGQTPEEQLAYVKNFLHPYFEARAEIEAQRQKLRHEREANSV